MEYFRQHYLISFFILTLFYNNLRKASCESSNFNSGASSQSSKGTEVQANPSIQITQDLLEKEGDENPEKMQYQILTKVLARRCAHHYSGMCFKLDLLRIVGALSNGAQYEVFPGVTVEFQRNFQNELPLQLIKSLVTENGDDAINKYLINRIKFNLNSISINYKLFEKTDRGKSLETSFWTELYKSIKGRKKNGGKLKSMLKTAGLMVGSSMLMVGMASIMALSAKAFIAATLSLFISAMSSYKGSSHGSYTQGSTTYEIIAKPMVSHSNAIAIEPNAETITDHTGSGGTSGNSGSGDHYRRTHQLIDASVEGIRGTQSVPLPVAHYSPSHTGMVYHAQINPVN